MAQQIETFADVINLWPTAAEYGRDIGITDVLARLHKKRNHIPSDYWFAVVDAAAKRGHSQVTHELLTKIGARKPVVASADQAKAPEGEAA